MIVYLQEMIFYVRINTIALENSLKHNCTDVLRKHLHKYIVCVQIHNITHASM